MCMSDDARNEFDDRRFERLFAAANEVLSADVFTAEVMRRIRRRSLVRLGVLGAAAALGLALALGPILGAVDFGSAALLTAAQRWHDTAWIEAYRVPLALLLVSLGWPLLVRLLAR